MSRRDVTERNRKKPIGRKPRIAPDSRACAVGELAERGPQRSTDFIRSKRDGLEQRQTGPEAGGDHRYRLCELLLHPFRAMSHPPPSPNGRDHDRPYPSHRSAREAGHPSTSDDASERADRSKSCPTKPTWSARVPHAPNDSCSGSDALSLHQICRHCGEHAGQRGKDHGGHLGPHPPSPVPTSKVPSSGPRAKSPSGISSPMSASSSASSGTTPVDSNRP